VDNHGTWKKTIDRIDRFFCCCDFFPTDITGTIAGRTRSAVLLRIEQKREREKRLPLSGSVKAMNDFQFLFKECIIRRVVTILVDPQFPFRRPEVNATLY